MDKNEFVTVEEMMERVKDIVCKAYKGKVFDKDVAIHLDIDHMRLATNKKRNTMPFKEVLVFCKRMNYDPMKLLF